MRAAPVLSAIAWGESMSAIYPPEYQQSPPQPLRLPPHMSWPRPHKILIMLAAAGVGVSVAACAGSVPGQGAAAAQAAQTAAAGTSASAVLESATEGRSSSPAASLRLLTEPGSGIGPIYRLITGARHSVDLTMYELAARTAEADLAADAARGVNV